MFLVPKLSGNEYSNLVTAFAVIISVEFGSGAYDAWDGFIGILAIVLGYSFIKEAKNKNDFWYSFLTSSLISLGIISLVSLVFFIVIGFSEPTGKHKFLYELFRFIVFASLSLVIWFTWVRNDFSSKTHRK